MDIRACIFDLDGVIVDTAKYHYLAWKRLAREELDYDFLESDNEQLKGVSRKRSLEILMELSGQTRTEDEQQDLMTKKNHWYLGYITQMTPNEILPGSVGFISDLKNIVELSLL